MSDLTTFNHSLPSLVDRAAAALNGARSSAEILEARELASVAYDAAKKAARLMKAKDAHDSLIAAAHRAQADALEIEAGAKRRLADEYDAAQERGEVAGDGRPKTVPDGNGIPTSADLGLTRKDIHDARRIRDAEQAQPGIVRQALDSALDRGEEPTRAEVQRSVVAAIKDAKGGSGKARNPVHRNDPERDRAVRFTSLCAEVADFEHLERVASWEGTDFDRARLVEKARLARETLDWFLGMCGEADAEIETGAVLSTGG